MIQGALSIIFLNVTYQLIYLSFKGDNVQIGASSNLLEDLKEITLGDLTFTLPNNIQELQDSVGGEGACVEVGYSLISTENDRGISYSYHIAVTPFLK